MKGHFLVRQRDPQSTQQQSAQPCW